MKTSKLVVFASILAITVLSLSISQNVNAKEFPKNGSTDRVSHMAFDQAIQNSGILQAMYEQLDDSVLQDNWPYYTAHIIYMRSDIYIQGSHEQWYFFLKDRLEYLKYHQQ
jgi:hypothetical protein